MVASPLDGFLDETAADPIPAAIRQDVDIAHPPDSRILEVGIDAETADADPPAVYLRHQQGLAGTREAVDAALPLINDAAKEPIAEGLALGEHLGEAIEGEIVQACDVILS